METAKLTAVRCTSANSLTVPGASRKPEIRGGKCPPMSHPCMLALRFPVATPLRSASLFWDVLRWSSSSRTKAGLRYTFGERRLRGISPAPSQRGPPRRRWKLGDPCRTAGVEGAVAISFGALYRSMCAALFAFSGPAVAATSPAHRLLTRSPTSPTARYRRQTRSSWSLARSESDRRRSAGYRVHPPGRMPCRRRGAP